MQPAPHHLHMTGANGSIHNESPIIKSSVPISKAIEMVRQQRNTINNKMQGIHGITGIANTNCTSSINTSDSLSDLEILQQNSGDHVYGQYRYQYSSNDADEDDEDISSHGSCGKKGGNGDGDDCSLLADVLAVMSLPKYSNLPGNPTGFKSGESTTSCSKLGGGFKHSDDDFHSYSSKNNDSEYRRVRNRVYAEKHEVSGNLTFFSLNFFNMGIFPTSTMRRHIDYINFQNPKSGLYFENTRILNLSFYETTLSSQGGNLNYA